MAKQKYRKFLFNGRRYRASRYNESYAPFVECFVDHAGVWRQVNNRRIDCGVTDDGPTVYDLVMKWYSSGFCEGMELHAFVLKMTNNSR